MACEQIRPVPPGFLHGLGYSPAANFFVIAAEQDFRYTPAPEFRGARVVGEVKKAMIRDSRPLIRDRTRVLA
jgi:hypothetical protein